MNRYPSLALDLPLKVSVWESEDGAVWLSYNSPEFLQKRHGLGYAAFRCAGESCGRGGGIEKIRKL